MARCRLVELAIGAVRPVEGVVVPAIPQGLGQGDELIGARIALPLAACFTDTEIARRVFAERGYDVPACAPAAQVVERTEFACHVVRVFVIGVDGGDQADMPGDGGNRRQQGEGLEGQADGGAARLGRDVAGAANEVGDEEAVEPGRLGQPGGAQPPGQVGTSAGARRRMAPGGRMVAVAL